MAETGTPGPPPAALIALLLAEPPANLLGLALRWVPADQLTACRIAALACTLIKAPLNPAAPKPEHEPAAKLLAELEKWLRPGKDTTAEHTALRVYCLFFACQLTPPVPDIADAAALSAAAGQVTAAADCLMRWSETGMLRRPTGWRLS